MKSMKFKYINYDISVFQILIAWIHKYKNTKCWKLTSAIFFNFCMRLKDIKCDIPVAHGTWHVLPFNWSPNSGQFVDEAYDGLTTVNFYNVSIFNQVDLNEKKPVWHFPSLPQSILSKNAASGIRVAIALQVCTAQWHITAHIARAKFLLFNFNSS